MVEYYYVTWVNDDEKPFIITCQCFNGYVKCAVKSGEIIYITFLHAGMVSLGLYPEELGTHNLFFQWKPKSITQSIYQIL